MTEVQDPALVEAFTIDLSSSVQPVQIPLQSHCPPVINTPTQLGVVYKLRVPLVPLFTLSVRIPSRAVPNTGAHPKCNSIHHLSRPSKPERFLPSKACTHPSHKQPVSPEEHLSVLLNGIGYFCFEKTRDLQTRIRSKI